MTTFKIRSVETITKLWTVEAENEEQAQEKAAANYNFGMGDDDDYSTKIEVCGEGTWNEEPRPHRFNPDYCAKCNGKCQMEQE